MTNLLRIILSTLIISLGSLIGILTLSINEKFLNKILLRLVALSSGALLGGAFIHLMPEGIEKLDPKAFFITVLMSMIVYLLIEKLLHWHHCHGDKDCPVHTFGYMNLYGDAVHNFIDGLIIAATYMVNVPLGIVTTIAMASHEIPQEIGDYGVLLYSGFSKRKALILNFIVATTIIAGGIVGWALFKYVNDMTAFLLPIASGGFLYIATSDLIPEIKKELHLGRFIVDLLFMLAGIALMYAAKQLGG